MTHVLAVTGWGESAACFCSLEQELRRRGAEVETIAAVDLGGLHGDYAGGLIERLHRPSVVVGWSLGGMVALAAALRSPGRFARLVLVGTTSDYRRSRGGQRASVELDTLRAALRSDSVAALRGFRKLVDGRSTREFLDADVVPPVDRLLSGLDYLERFSVAPLVSSLAVPCSVVHGEADRVIPVREAEMLAGAIAGARCVIVPKGEHALPWTHPELVGEETLRR